MATAMNDPKEIRDDAGIEPEPRAVRIVRRGRVHVAIPVETGEPLDDDDDSEPA